MSVLARTEILTAIEQGEIEITPFDPKNVGCASIDLTLGNEFRFFKPSSSVIPIREDTDYKNITRKVEISDSEGYLLLPGQTCLGITKERVKIAPSLCGLLEGRSRFARLGLFVHITAGFMNPGINNQQVLEIYNASNHPFSLHPGEKVCQFIFIRMTGEAKYEGKFAKNKL